MKHERAEQLENVLLHVGDMEEKVAIDASEEQPMEVHDKGEVTIDTSQVDGEAIDEPEKQ